MAARRKRDDDDHVCPAVESYLMTYSDMITALLVLFITLFAMGQIDIAKFEKFKSGIANSGATPIDDGLLENGEGVFEQAIIRPEIISSPDDLDGPGGTGDDTGFGPTQGMANGTQVAEFQQTQRDLTEALEALDLDGAVSYRIESRGLVVSIVSDKVLFAPGSATLSEDGQRIVDTIATQLRGMDNEMTVEGHTDSVPISTARFPSNWELSVGRASAVLRTLVEEHGFPAARMHAAGYGEHRPVASNETAVGRQANRRVELVIHSSDDTFVPDFGEGV